MFSDDDARSAPEKLLNVGFDRVEGGWRAKLNLRSMTRSTRATCCRCGCGRASYDLILCRNTVIYFAEPIRDELHARLAEALRPGGYPRHRLNRARLRRRALLGLAMQHPFIYRKA